MAGENNFILKLENLNLSFGGVQALVDINLDVQEKEILAIIGPNGAGKTSLLNCISGLYHPQKGRIVYINGEESELTRLKPQPNARPKRTVVSLSYGLQKRVEMGRALALRPSVLLLDEPMAGMNAEEKEDMARFVLDINEEHGVTIVLIEHDMGGGMDISDPISVLTL